MSRKDDLHDIEGIRYQHEGEHLTQPCKVIFDEDGIESDCDVHILLAEIDHLRAQLAKYETDDAIFARSVAVLR